MILPRSVAGHELINAAAVGIDDRAWKCVGALIERVRNAVVVLVGLAGKGEASVERSLMGDVGADAQPIRREVVVANPALEIANEDRRGCRFGGREPQKTGITQ